MRVSLINLNLDAKDAIGRYIMDKARYFLGRGDQVRIYAQFISQDIPGDITPLVSPCTLSQLIGSQSEFASLREHFFSSDLYIYDYPNWYQLVDSIRIVDRGVVVLDYHGVTPPELWRVPEAMELLERSVEALPEIVRHADYAIGHSAFTHGELVDKYGYDPVKAFHFPYAVPLDDFTPGDPDPKLMARYALKGRQVLLYVGRMAYNKRIDLLIKAMPLIQESCPEAKLLLVGDNKSSVFAPIVAELESLVESLGLADSVAFTGRVEDLPAHYRLADVYVTSSMHEGFCVPLVESMAMGLPIVGSDIAAIPHTMGEAGLLFEPENMEDLVAKVVSILDDVELADELRNRGFARAPQFSLENLLARWDKVLDVALAYQPALTEVATVGQVDHSDDFADPPAVEPSPAVEPVAAPRAGAPRLPDLEEHFAELEMGVDVSLHDYQVRSGAPVVGKLIVWVRRNLTSHLKEPYVDPIVDRQVHANRRMVWSIRDVYSRVRELSGHLSQSLADTGRRLEAWIAGVQESAEERDSELGAELADLRAAVADLRQTQTSGDGLRSVVDEVSRNQEGSKHARAQLRDGLGTAKSEIDELRAQLGQVRSEQTGLLSRLDDVEAKQAEGRDQVGGQLAGLEEALRQEMADQETLFEGICPTVEQLWAWRTAEIEAREELTRRMASAEEKEIQLDEADAMRVAEDRARVSRDARLVAGYESLRAEQAALASRQDVLGRGVHELRALLGERPESVTRDVHELRMALEAISPQMRDRIDALSALPQSGDTSGLNYFLHADSVGGSAQALRAIYAPLVDRFREAPDVVDLGCGSGVFLDLLREADIPAYGVDLDEDSLVLCRKKGLDVRKGDLMAHLRDLDDKSLGGIFASHVIEHLSIEGMFEFMQLCYDKLIYGGPMVLVTPNGGALTIFYHTFYKDLTHQKPLHPDALRFLLETNGFRRVEVSTASPLPDDFKLAPLDVDLAENEVQRQWAASMNWNLARVNQIVFGDQDCVASAVK
jgi:glycosyltransferase involved in cell wall biosynthesis/SAM-dependent methyltransferase